MKARPQSQLPLPPMEVRTSHPGGASVRKSHQAAPAVRKSHQATEAIDRAAAEALAADVFTRALEAAAITRDEAAFLMGVTRSMVDQMCAPTVAKAPSLIQVLLLGPAFHLALIHELDKHFGLGRAALARVQQALGTLGLMLR